MRGKEGKEDRGHDRVGAERERRTAVWSGGKQQTDRENRVSVTHGDVLLSFL